jgi:hypothetical protein
MHENQVFFQCEEDSVVTDSQTIFSGPASQLFHVAVQLVLEQIEPLADSAPLVRWQLTQLGQSLFADFQPIIHMASPDPVATRGKGTKYGI